MYFLWSYIKTIRGGINKCVSVLVPLSDTAADLLTPLLKGRSGQNSQCSPSKMTTLRVEKQFHRGPLSERGCCRNGFSPDTGRCLSPLLMLRGAMHYFKTVLTWNLRWWQLMLDSSCSAVEETGTKENHSPAPQPPTTSPNTFSSFFVTSINLWAPCVQCGHHRNMNSEYKLWKGQDGEGSEEHIRICHSLAVKRHCGKVWEDEH